jgi:hypothetical protein
VSYREENGQVILTMSRDDWQHVLLTFGYAAGAMSTNGDQNSRRTLFELLNRINEGNPHYTPYQVEEKKS